MPFLLSSSCPRDLWITINFGGLFLLHTMSVSNIFFPKKLWMIEKHFSNRRFSYRCVFCNFFLLFFDFLQTQWVNWMIFFSLMCWLVGFEALYISKFFHLNRFRNQISPPNVFLWKFQHPFLALKHYNLIIYVNSHMNLILIHVIYTHKL